MPTLTGQDLESLKLAGQAGVTGVMQPFVRGAQDVKNLRAALKECGAGELEILAKLENQTGLDQLEHLDVYKRQP